MADLHDRADDVPETETGTDLTDEVTGPDEPSTPEALADETATVPDTALADESTGPVDHEDAALADATAEDETDAAKADTTTPAESEEERAAREAEEQLLRLFQSTVFGPGNQKIGRVGQVYLDDQSLKPNWVTVKTGLFGTKEFFVPLDEAEFEGKQIVLPYGKEQVLASPRTEIDQNLSPQEEDDLYNHYRVPGRMTTTAESDPVGMPDSAPAVDVTPEADAAAVDAPAPDAEVGADETHAFAETVDEQPADEAAVEQPLEAPAGPTQEPLAAGATAAHAEGNDDLDTTDAEVPDTVADDIAHSQGRTADEVFADMFPDRDGDTSAFAPPADDERTERA